MHILKFAFLNSLRLSLSPCAFIGKRDRVTQHPPGFEDKLVWVVILVSTNLQGISSIPRPQSLIVKYLYSVVHIIQILA